MADPGFSDAGRRCAARCHTGRSSTVRGPSLNPPRKSAAKSAPGQPPIAYNMTMKLIYAALAATLLVAPAAHADDGDSQFLGALSRDGIAITADQAIPIAHETCDADNLPRISIGMPAPNYQAHLRINDELSRLGINGPQVGQFKRDAVVAHCPQLGDASGHVG
jgi:hypothetical protein